MFEYPDFIQNILGIATIGLGIFSFIVMIVVFQAALAAKQYFDRENKNHWRQSIPQQQSGKPSP